MSQRKELLFKSKSEIAVFYYSGHGSFDAVGGYLCTSEITRSDEGLSLNDLMGFVGKSQAQNNIIILDSCSSGCVANSTEMSNYSIIHSGTTILAACGETEYALEENGHGIYTSLLVEALHGGAMNLLGDVSPGSIYSYIDRSLGSWEPRPVFKANINGFVSLRKNVPPISILELRRITEIFSSPYDEYKLDPQIQKQIRYTSVVVCSNRPANNNGMSIEEIRYAVDIGKPVVAVKITDSTSSSISNLNIPVIANRKDSLENWIALNA